MSEWTFRIREGLWQLVSTSLSFSSFLFQDGNGNQLQERTLNEVTPTSSFLSNLLIPRSQRPKPLLHQYLPGFRGWHHIRAGTKMWCQTAWHRLAGQWRHSKSHESNSFTKIKTDIFETQQRGKRLQKPTQGARVWRKATDPAAAILLAPRPPLL